MTTLKRIEDNIIGKKYKPGIEFHFIVAVPETEVSEYALLVEHDGENEENVNSMLTLADEGKAPYCISLGVVSGNLTLPDGSVMNVRMNSFDLFDREYADFIVYELIPYAKEKYGLKISDSPDMHMVSGGSSGGVSALAMAWFHPEYFHRVYMSSPSFLAMGRGNELPYLIRKYETKPLRIYQEWSENEPNDYFGWSRSVDEDSNEALKFAGYDYNGEFFPAEGHCARYHTYENAYKRNEWLWQNYKTKSITAPANSPRVDTVIPFGSKWESCDSFPEKSKVEAPKALKDFDNVILATDKHFWYAANKNEDIVYSFVNDSQRSADKKLLHATLHTIPRIDPKGAVAITVDATDRLYALTAIGIQCVRSFGLIDVILDLPDDSTPVDIAVTDALYVKTEKGIYRRELCADCTRFENPQRKFISYYD